MSQIIAVPQVGAPNLINKHEVAQMLRVSLSCVDARIRERTLAHFKVGRRVLFSKKHVESFLADFEIAAAANPKAEVAGLGEPTNQLPQ